jgi:nucleotide-binding universal stress UspA family protein
MYPIKTILHPTDYSESSAVAFDVACALARDYRAELIVCHVSPPPIPAVVDGMVFEIPSGAEEEMTEKLKTVRPADPGIHVSYRLARGDAAKEVLAVAPECKADLIVMGTHGRGGISRLLMGSVAEAVLRSAPCPVVTVRALHVPPPMGKQDARSSFSWGD